MEPVNNSLSNRQICTNSLTKLLKGNLFCMHRSSRQRCSVRKDALRNSAKFTGKHLCQSLLFNKVAGLGLSFLIKLQAQACKFIKKETLVQIFPCGFCEISKKTFFTVYLQATASVCKNVHSSHPITITESGSKLTNKNLQLSLTAKTFSFPLISMFFRFQNQQQKQSLTDSLNNSTNFQKNNQD